MDHEFPELRPPLIAAGIEQAQEAVLSAVRTLGWQEIDSIDGEIGAVVVSPLLRFRDDVKVRFEGTAAGTLLYARSASRVGKADLAANARHLRELFAELGSPDHAGNNARP